MNNRNPQSRLIFFLIVVGLIVLFGRFFLALLPLLIIIWILSRIFADVNWQQRWKDFQQKGFDISAFQKEAPPPPQKNKTSFRPFSSSFMDHFQFRPRHIAGIIGILIVAFIIIDGLVSVPAGHVAVIYDRGRGVLSEEMPEGLHLKIPFWQVATIMDTRLQAYTMSIATHEGQRVGDDSIEALTRDGQKVDIDMTIQYRIDREKASDIYQSVGLDYEDKVVRPEVRSVIREVVTGYESKQLFDIQSRQQASEQMKEQLTTQYAKKSIILESLLLRNVRFSDVYLNAIEEKQVAEQKIQKAEFEKQEAVKRKEKTIIEAEAEAEAIRLRGEALSQNPEVIQLEFIQKMAPEINWGILPDAALPLIDIGELGR